MSEQRFTFNVNKYQIEKDGEYFAYLDVTTVKKIVNELNEQQATIEQLKSELNDCEKIRYSIFEKMNELNYIQSNPVTLKEAEDQESFKFNKNCAKPYEIRSVSPNGVVRTGKKNSKVSWRMKDVREISQELPPFEDFNRETLQGISNKFHTKFDNDVVGRIIYNIYVGTFDEYI